MSHLARFTFCIFILGLALYSYIRTHNRLTELRITVPILEKKVRLQQEENVRLAFELEKFESPGHLMELAKRPEYGHLKYPYAQDIIRVEYERE